jgi:alpha-1,2-mannosyltransferase
VTRWRTAALVLFVVSVAARLVVTWLSSGGEFVDLRVYVEGGARLTDGSLYSFFYHVPPMSLPFTYPPFAAIVFYPLHLLPFGVVGFCWQAGIIAALYGSVVIALKLIGRHSTSAALAATAVAIWTEPLRGVFQWGQIGVLLMLVTLWAVYSTRWWLSGLLVGLAAGVKLTPAVTGLYLVGERRWRAAIFSSLVFSATVLVAWPFVGWNTVSRYFTRTVLDAHRIGSMGDFGNQSLRAALSRIAGHDIGSAVYIWIAAMALLVFFAWRAITSTDSENRDQLGAVLVIQLFGLMAEPVSWTHHWVWLVPLVLWLGFGPICGVWGARTLAAVWSLIIVVQILSLLILDQTQPWQISVPWYLAWPAAIYAAMSLVTLGWIVIAPRQRSRESTPSELVEGGELVGPHHVLGGAVDVGIGVDR